MRAARLLQLLLLLQNRGRMTCTALSDELEVTRRTVLRDVEALTEAGLPILTTRGNQGGVELGFNYRTRLTGLGADEAEALGVLLARPCKALDELGMRTAANRALGKLTESFPDTVRARVHLAAERYSLPEGGRAHDDPRVAAFASAIRARNIVHVRGPHARTRVVHPVRMERTLRGWRIFDARPGEPPLHLRRCGNINISAKTF